MATILPSSASVLAAGVPVSESSHVKKTVLVCTAAATLLTVAVCLSRPRPSKATKEESLEAVSSLRREFAAAYADVSGVVARHGSPVVEPAKADAAENKLQQALEQPLVLEAALREATARVAAARGCSPEALERDVRRHEDSEEVQQEMAEIKAMHAACLAGGSGKKAPGGKALVGTWEQDEALDMLREIGAAKAEKLRSICAGQLGAEASCPPAAALIAACSEAEQEVWGRHPGAANRRSSLGLALEEFAASSPDFARKRAALEAELEAAICT